MRIWLMPKLLKSIGIWGGFAILIYLRFLKAVK